MSAPASPVLPKSSHRPGEDGSSTASAAFDRQQLENENQGASTSKRSSAAHVSPLTTIALGEQGRNLKDHGRQYDEQSPARMHNGMTTSFHGSITQTDSGGGSPKGANFNFNAVKNNAQNNNSNAASKIDAKNNTSVQSIDTNEQSQLNDGEEESIYVDSPQRKNTQQTAPSFGAKDSASPSSGADEQEAVSSSNNNNLFSCCCPGEKVYPNHPRPIPVCRSGVSAAEDAAIHREFHDNSIYTTKYSIKPWNLNFFIWKMLWEQFQRKANLYFLVIGSIQMIPGISPTGQFTTMSTLVIVILFSFLKNGIEDIARYRRDSEINSSPAYVLKSFEDKTWRQVTYADIRVGDIVRVDNLADPVTGRKNNGIPCDLILLTTSEEDGSCYVETANLDGETNLKMRKASDFTHIRRVQSISEEDRQELNLDNDQFQQNEFIAYENMDDLAVMVEEKYREMSAECEQPNMNLYRFSGNLVNEEWDEKGIQIENNQTLYRGCSLRKVHWAVGLCVFTGHETKVMRNASDPPHKASRVERLVNKLMLIVLTLQAILCVIGAIGKLLTVDNSDWYIANDSIDNKSLHVFEAFLTFVILTNNFIPISLYVSLEFIKYYQGRLMEQDLCMYYPPKDMPAVAKATDLNEELGQINFVFCDKTGTLTRNVMHFLKFGVGGEIYGQGTTEIGRAAARRQGRTIVDERPEKVINSNDPFWDPRMVDNRWVSLDNAEDIRQFFMALAICHTVVVDNGVYEAESPDEEALVRAARKFGYTFKNRASDHIILETKNGAQHRIEILEVIHFSSDRKRMSVVCKLPNGDYVIYSKGAETTMFPRLRDGTDFDTAERIQNQFAEEGLRPLVVAHKNLEPSFAKQWLKNMKQARGMIGRDAERDELIDEYAIEVECDLKLVGITGVEDKLQDQVPETILALRNAGISVWMLTGDKRETAINIGFACDFLHKKMKIIEVFGYKKKNTPELLQKLKESAELDQSEEVSCVIDGHTLALILNETENREIFYNLAKRCTSVICCRVSPKQKSEVVELMKFYSGDSVTTLAIGDGANDVPMIQAAHVGVGISGMEGQQAANSADFAIGQFKYLHRLMMIHGRANYGRLSLVINYFFYKNALLVMTQFWYCIFNFWTGQSLYEQWTLASWNVVFTSIPVLIVGILDRDILNTDRIHACPQLYKRGLTNEALNFYVFSGWVLVAVYHSAVCFFGVIFGSNEPVGQLVGTNGITMGLDGAGITLYTVIIIVATTKLGFHVKSFSAYHWITLLGSVAAWFGFLVVYSAVDPTTSTTVFAVLENVGFVLMPWLFALLMCILCLFPDIVYKYALFNFHMWCPKLHPLKAREAVMMKDAEDNIAAIRVPRELLRRRQRASDRHGGTGGKGVEDEDSKEKLFKSAAEEFEDSIHTRQGWLLEFVDQEVEDAYREFTFGELRRYKIGLGISSLVSSLIVANFGISDDVKQIELGGWALFSIVSWFGFGIVMFIPHKILRNYIHYVMCCLLLVGFSGMSIANLSGSQRNPATHPVTSGVILLGLIVLIRPPLVHAVMYVVMNTILYVAWYQVFRVEQWSINELLVRILELIIVAVTSLIALAATERFTRKVFVSQLQVKRAVKAVTREEERSMLLLQNVFPAAIVQELREVKRPLADFSCTFHESSMLNSDIVKFTQFSSTKEPHVVVEMLNRMFTKFDAHAALLGLEKIKTIGDAYLCAGGIPVPDEYHQRKIISMGRKMVHSMFEMNKEGLPSLPNLDVHIRVGAATGPIRAGVVGLQKACFDVFGEVSEESEHMESSGRPDRVQVTDELYEAAKEYFQFEQLENKEGKMGYFVIDDGIEPFMGLKWQIEEQRIQQQGSGTTAAPENPLNSLPDQVRDGSGSRGSSNNNNNNSGRDSRQSDNGGSGNIATGFGSGHGRSELNSISAMDKSTFMPLNADLVHSKSGSKKPASTRTVVASSKAGSASAFDTHFAEDGSPLESANSALFGGKLYDDDQGSDVDASSRDGATSRASENNFLGGAPSDGKASPFGDGADIDADGVTRVNVSSRLRPLTNDEHLEDLYKFLEDNNAERLDLVDAYAGFTGEKNTYDLNFVFDRAEEEFRMYYQKLAESRLVLETVQGFLIFGICALLVALHISEVAHWFVIAQIVVAAIHIIFVIVYAVMRRMQKMEEEEAKKKAVFNFGNEDPNNTALGDAGMLGEDLHNNPTEMTETVGISHTVSSSPSPTSFTTNPLASVKRNRRNKREGGDNDDLGKNGGVSKSDNFSMAVDDGLTQEDLFDSDDEEKNDEVDPTSPQFNLSHLKSEHAEFVEPPVCTWIRTVIFFSGLLSFSMPIVLVLLIDYSEIEVIMVFVMLASVVYITSFLHMRFGLKVFVTLLHLAAVTAAFFLRVIVQRPTGLRTTEDGGNYLAVVLCYILCIIAGYATESNVRGAFAVAKRVVFQNAELLSAIDKCDKLLKNVLPVSIVRRMIADPTKAIVDEVEEASVLFLYADGVRPHTEAEAEGKASGRMVNEMNDFLFIMDCLCMYHHVEKIKTVPYLVVSGCPEPIARHCSRLAALARDVIVFADAYNKLKGTNIRVKAGLNSGKVTAGVLGATKFIYDVFGDTVNFASRLASSSSWGVVQCSEHARKLLDGFTEVIDRGEIELKGKGMQKVFTLDLDSIDLKIAPIVRQMTPAGQLDVESFREFDPHMKILQNHISAQNHRGSLVAAGTNSSANAIEGGGMGEKQTTTGSSGSGNNQQHPYHKTLAQQKKAARMKREQQKRRAAQQQGSAANVNPLAGLPQQKRNSLVKQDSSSAQQPRPKPTQQEHAADDQAIYEDDLDK